VCHGASRFNPSNLLPRYSKTISEGDDASHGLLLHSSQSTWVASQKRQDVLLSSSSSQAEVSHERPVELMTSTGTILSLPMELVTPYARAAARLGLHNASRYHIDSVYHERGLISGSVMGRHPFVNVEAVYDVVREDFTLKSSASTQHIDALPPHTRAQISERKASIETEVIATALDLVDRVDPKRVIGQRYLRIGDSRLGNAILDLCAAPYPRTDALRALSAISDEALTQKWKNSPTQDLFLNSCSLLAEIGLPVDVQRALQPFVKVITSISNPHSLIGAINNVPSLSSPLLPHVVSRLSTLMRSSWLFKDRLSLPKIKRLNISKQQKIRSLGKVFRRRKKNPKRRSRMANRSCKLTSTSSPKGNLSSSLFHLMAPHSIHTNI
jgi:hypothetical protein